MPLFLDDPLAQKWIVKYLKKSPGRIVDSDLSRIPPRCESPDKLFEAGYKEGFGVTRLRRARKQLDGRVIVIHVPGSKQWMWKLIGE